MLKSVFRFVLFASLGFAAVAEAQTDNKHHDMLKKLQVMNRVYQICFGRGLTKPEVAVVLPMAQDDIVHLLIASPELSAVYASRLATYSTAANSQSLPTSLTVPQAVKDLAKPDQPLAGVLQKLGKNRHSGAECGDAANALCFAQWLVGRVAPTLGAAWTKKNADQIHAWTYAELLKQISLSSI